MGKKIYNFSAGPAILPKEVLQETQENLMELPGVGMSILEISHRSKPFDDVINRAKADIKMLLGIGDDYSIMF
ncbi:MAG: aminotransferase class V-fold PLP-dependent enzyme, partial [Ignavibacteriaceae bacterium]